MEYKGIKFDAVVATPCCGKSYLCDKYPDRFVDADEVVIDMSAFDNGMYLLNIMTENGNIVKRINILK